MIKAAIGTEIRRLRQSQKLTLESLAHNADMGLTFLKELEAGQKQATATTLFKLAKALHTTPDLLIMPAYKAWLKEQP